MPQGYVAIIDNVQIPNVFQTVESGRDKLYTLLFERQFARACYFVDARAIQRNHAGAGARGTAQRPGRRNLPRYLQCGHWEDLP